MSYALTSVPSSSSLHGLGLSIPGLPGVDTGQIVNGIVGAVGPPVTAYVKSQLPGILDELKKQIPGLVDAVRPQIESGIHQLIPIVESEARKMGTELWNSPDVKKMKREAMIAGGIYALLIVGGTWAAVKFL